MKGESEVPGRALNLISTNYPDHGHHGRLPLSRKNAHGRAGNRTRDLMVSSQELWPPSHEAGQLSNVYIGKAILKPIWTYGIQLWGSASNTNIDILGRFQPKVLRIFTDAPWYVPNTVIRRDLECPPTDKKCANYSVTYRHRLDAHPNRLAKSLFQGPAPNRWLKRC